MDILTYQNEAQVTLSHSFFGEYVELRELLDALNDAIIACAKVDKLKKVLFYGRGINGRAEVARKPFSTLGAVPLTGQQETILHALIGIGTEGAECLEILRDWVHGMITGGYGEDFESVAHKHPHETTASPKSFKLQEESGGTLWYIAILAEAMGITVEDIAGFNIAQLRARYKDKFDAFEANKRNLAFEHSVMVNMASSGKQASAMIDVATPETFRDHEGREHQLPTADDEKQRAG